jgi:Protein of unknown function (DUF2934)
MPSPERPKTVRKPRIAARPSSRSNGSTAVSESDIAARAFSYYCERGFQHGSDIEDWLRAERELTEMKKPARRRAAH